MKYQCRLKIHAAHSISMLAKDVPRARAIFKQALGENPNASTVHMLASMNLSFLDRPAEALEHARYSVLLSPKDPMRHAAYLSQGAALFQLGRYSEAVEAARTALSIRSSFVMTHLMLIASLAQEGDITSARAAVSDLRQLRPDLDLTEQSKLPIFTVPRSAERWREGWRLAGLLP